MIANWILLARCLDHEQTCPFPVAFLCKNTNVLIRQTWPATEKNNGEKQTHRRTSEQLWDFTSCSWDDSFTLVAAVWFFRRSEEKLHGFECRQLCHLQMVGCWNLAICVPNFQFGTILCVRNQHLIIKIYNLCYFRFLWHPETDELLIMSVVGDWNGNALIIQHGRNSNETVRL